MTQDRRRLTGLIEIMKQLLGPEGCPWDREQTHETLKPYIVDEAYEAVDAIEAGSAASLCEELGDVLLLVVFHAELARLAGEFTVGDVIEGISDKLVRRHPHVFGSREATTPEEVTEQWDRIKREEGRRGVTTGVPRSMPALARAHRIGERLAKVGFDWDDFHGPRAKVDEELAELDEAISRGDDKETRAELGDALLALANLSRHLGHEPEDSLRSALDRFESRFERVEQLLEARGKEPRECEIDELEETWQEAKRALARTGEE